MLQKTSTNGLEHLIQEYQVPQNINWHLQNAIIKVQNMLHSICSTTSSYRFLKTVQQGSFELGTMVNCAPLDADLGLYLTSYHHEPVLKVDSLYREVKQLLSLKRFNSHKILYRDTCVRLLLTEQLYLDIPIFWCHEDRTYYGHRRRGWIKADPERFTFWVKAKLTNSPNLREVIQLLKLWNKHLHEPIFDSHVITILACKGFIRGDCLTQSFLLTAKSISSRLEERVKCMRPTPPRHENLLKLSEKDQSTLLRSLKRLTQQAQELHSNNAPPECWQYLLCGSCSPTMNEVAKSNNLLRHKSAA